MESLFGRSPNSDLFDPYSNIVAREVTYVCIILFAIDYDTVFQKQNVISDFFLKTEKVSLILLRLWYFLYFKSDYNDSYF